VFEKRVLMRIFGPKRYLRRKLQEKLHNMYSSPNIIRTIKSGIRCGRACSAHGRESECVQVFDRKT
jgi:hypothetical protein